MDIKTELKLILKEVSEGNLIKALRFMKTLTPEAVNNKPVINIIVALYQLVNNAKLKDKIAISNIKELIVLCCSKITSPNQSEIINYLRSLFHLIKYLANKMVLSELMCVCKCIFPDWVSKLDGTDDINELIVHFTILIHNDIIVVHSKTKDVKSLIKCFWLHLRLYKYIFYKQPTTFFSKINRYCNLLHKNYDFKSYSNFLLDIFGLLVSINKLPDKETVKLAYDSLLCIIYIYFSKTPKDFNKNGSEVEQFFEILEKFSSFDGEHVLCTEIFKLFYELNVRKLSEYKTYDVILFKTLRENSEKLQKNYGLTDSVRITFTYMSRLVTSLISDLETAEKESWLKYMKIEIQIEYMKVFKIISQVISKAEFKDNCSKNCTVVTDLTHAFTLTSISGTFFNLSIQYGTPNFENLHEIVISSLTDSFQYIDKLKSGNCNRWMANWKIIGPIIYNIGSRFLRIGNHKLAKTYFQFLSKYIVIFDGIENKKSFIENLLGTCLYTISVSYCNLKKYRRALTYASFAILLCPPLQNKVWPMWCNIKSNANVDNIGNISEFTINYILETDADIIRLIYPSYIFDSKKMVDLLFLEIKAYEKTWASKIPLKNACNELVKICKDPILCTKALSIPWEKLLCLLDEGYMENVLKTIASFNKNTKASSLINQVCLSVLYFIDYQYKSYEVLKNNLTEMNDTVKEQKPVLKPYEEPVNPNDTCDIIPTYRNNKMENNMHLQKILLKSVDLWNKILENKNVDSVKELILELKINKAIEKTAHEFRLHNYSFQELKVWFLYFQYGKLFDRKDIILTSIGFILAAIDCNTKTAKDMIELAENLVKDFIESDDQILIEAIVTYYVNKSTGYLNSNILMEGYNELRNSEKYIKVLNTPKLLQARILYLKSLYHQKSCSMQLIEHDKNAIVLLQNAFTTIAEFYKEGGGKCLFSLSVLFDISFSIGQMYKWLRMPRETRSYTSESVLLAQQMVLPLRTTQFFSILGFTDLLGCQFDDCKVKLSGIDYILCYRSSSKFTKSIIEQIDQDKILEVSKEFENLTLTRNDHGIEAMLDVPMDHRLRNNRGSPILESKPFKIPAFIYHIDCSCFYCLNIDYQILVLECIHLEAVFSSRQNNERCAADYFKGGLGLFKGLQRKYNSLCKSLSEDLLLQYKKKLEFTYSQFLLDFSFYYAKKRDYEEALKVIDKIFEVSGEDVKSNAYFYSEVLMQKITLLTAIEFKDIKPKKIETCNELIVDYDIFASKTPENKLSVAQISVMVSPCIDTLPKKNKKPHIKFDIFASEDENEEEKSPEIKNKIFKMKTPGITPAPNFTKLTINPTNVNKQNKVQPICTDLFSTNIPKKKTEISKLPVESESKVKTRKILEKRTKLLTEKLKTEKKTALKESNRTNVAPASKKEENGVKNQKENIPSRKLRKNLMDELIESDVKDEVFESKVKISTRSRAKTNLLSAKETGKLVKTTGNKQYKRIVRDSNSSDESIGKRSTRSVSKIS